MAAENITLGFALVLGGVLVIAVCIPLLQGQIKPNVLYGMRLPKSFASDENWFKINRYGAKQMMRWAGVMIVVGLVTFFLPLQGNALLTGMVGLAPIVLLLIPAFQIYRYARTL
jgi:uncharacterized membrane protein